MKNGNVGIGTTNPQGKLELFSSRGVLRLFSNPSVPGCDLGYDGGTDQNFTFAHLGNENGITVFASPGKHILRLYNKGDVAVPSGNLIATSKLFDIPDPRYNNDKKRLIHASLEGPENGVYYRGESRLVNRTPTINLPDYFESLTLKEGRTIQLTAKNRWSPLYVNGEVINGKFVVKTTEQGDPDQEFYWEVKAVRADIESLKVEVIL